MCVQRTLTIGGSITVQLVSSLPGLDSVIYVHTNNNILSSFVELKPVKLDTRCTVIIPPKLSVLWCVEDGNWQCLAVELQTFYSDRI